MALLAAICSGSAFAQYPAADVTLESESGTQCTFLSNTAADKGKEAVQDAIAGTFYTLFTTGVEGVKSGKPMLAGDNKPFMYRFFNEELYNRYLVGKPVKVSEQKVNGIRQVTVRLTVNMKGLQGAVAGGGATLNPAWADKAATPTGTEALNPVVIVVPYVKGAGDDGFQAMKEIVDNDPVKTAALEKITSLFTENGYKTRDFRRALSNSKTSGMLNQDAQDDVKSMIVRQLPGDIIVTVDVNVEHPDAHKSSCTVRINAVEAQTEGTLGSASYSSGVYMTSDGALLVDYALSKVEKKFFGDLKDAFKRMIAEGRPMAIEFNISQDITDWDFTEPTPETGSDFMTELEDWLDKNSFHGVYNMGNSSDKYISATLNIPIWDTEKDRGYTTSRFAADLRKFLRQQFGDLYKADVTSMGQKLNVTIR